VGAKRCALHRVLSAPQIGNAATISAMVQRLLRDHCTCVQRVGTLGFLKSRLKTLQNK
jgi:hypothetical protein